MSYGFRFILSVVLLLIALFCVYGVLETVFGEMRLTTTTSSVVLFALVQGSIGVLCLVGVYRLLFAQRYRGQK